MSGTDLRRTTLGTAMVLALLLSGAIARPARALADEVRAVAVGGQHACALKTNGAVWCWGDDSRGQLGDGTTGDADHRRLTPAHVRRGGGYLANITSVSAGQYHTCAIRQDGAVFCWGDDEYGQLGDGTTGDANHDRLRAVRVRKGTGFLTDVRSVAAGSFDTCAVKTDGRTWCWGDDGYGELGDGAISHPNDISLEPVGVRQGDGYLVGARSVGAGAGHACVVKADGTVWCWGYAGDGQVGDGTRGNPDFDRPSAVQVRHGSGHLTGIVRLGAGTSYHTCAVRGDGAAFCWGRDSSGELGDGTMGDVEGDRLKAVRVKKGTGYLSDVGSIASGWSHTCAALTDGTAWCWGQAEHGEVGDGTTGDADSLRLHPRQVIRGSGHLPGVRSVGAGSFDSCAARKSPTAWCWGKNDHGQLGDGTTDTSLEPVRVLFP